MADIYIMNHKEVDTETSKGVNMADSSDHHFEDQMLSKNHNNVVDKIETEIVEIVENHHHVEHDDQVVDDVAINITAMLQDRIEAILQDKNESLLSSKCCIYRVPHGIRKYNPEAYTPQVVSIGPLHYNCGNLENMERHKLVFFKLFMARSHTSLDKLIAIVKNSEPNIRECYSIDVGFITMGFVQMILVDAGFIIELFLKIHEGNLFSKIHEGGKYSLDDSTLSTLWITNKIILDLMMLENQLPFFILEELFNLALPPHTRVNLPSFLELTFEFFGAYNVQKLDPRTTPNFSIKHFTDLLRTFHLKQKKSERVSFGMMGSDALLYGANELHEAGVKFIPTNKCLLDLNFKRGVLKIPLIIVQEETEYELRNMIALEHCHYPFESYICDYALFLDRLINTRADVDILVRMQIIHKFLVDSDKVAQVFNGLCKDIHHKTFNVDYLNMCKKLNAFYENPRKNLIASWREEYGKTPWQTIASIGGIVVIILTLVQTICSIIQLSPNDSKFV